MPCQKAPVLSLRSKEDSPRSSVVGQDALWEIPVLLFLLSILAVSHETHSNKGWGDDSDVR